MGRDDSADGSDLPALYRSPWSALGDNLLAAGADIALRSRELRRRNREGSLWRPSWWWADLAPLFWPVVLATALAAVLGLGVLLIQTMHHPPAGDSASAELAVAPPADTEPSDAVPWAPAAPQPLRAPDGPDAMAEQPSPQEEPSGRAVAPPAVAPADPLAALLSTDTAAGWIQAAEGRADTGLLVLQLTPAYGTLSPAEQQRRAVLWQAMAAELGYDHLELRDSRSGLLGRDALVGEGMILFSPSPAA